MISFCQSLPGAYDHRWGMECHLCLLYLGINMPGWHWPLYDCAKRSIAWQNVLSFLHNSLWSSSFSGSLLGSCSSQEEQWHIFFPSEVNCSRWCRLPLRLISSGRMLTGKPKQDTADGLQWWRKGFKCEDIVPKSHFNDRCRMSVRSLSLKNSSSIVMRNACVSLNPT